MATSNIKLTYFNVRGLAETIRFLLKYGDIEFEDDRFERDKWPEIKPNVPFGQVPLYEENGKVANQSIAIARYVAKKVGLVGDNDWENLEIDAIVDTITDLRLKVLVYFHEQDPERKETLKQTVFGETVPFYLERLDDIAGENNGHLAIGKGNAFFYNVTSVIGVLTQYPACPFQSHKSDLSYPDIREHTKFTALISGRKDNRLEENGEKTRFMWLGWPNLTWADFFFTCVISQFDHSLGSKIRDKYPNLKAVINNVLEIPSIKAWVEIRPKTDF